MQPWIIAIIVIGAAICLTFALAAITYAAAFGKRCDKNPLLTYYTANDFNLTSDNFPLAKLYGEIYENKSVKARDEVVIFAHGMGPGRCAYTTEIAYLCSLGYTVVAVDSLGCGDSFGKNIRGIYEGVRSTLLAIGFTKKQFEGKKIYLVGHSWGAYSVLCASAEREVEKVVAISAPSTPVKALRGGAAKFVSKPLAYILSPFWYVINFLKFGAKGNLNAVKSARKSKAEILLVQGDKDTAVLPENAAYYGVYGENVTKFLAKGKAHNPYNTARAEEKLSKLNSALIAARKMTDEERKSYFKSFDYKAATEEDIEVMGAIKEFLED